MPYALPGFIPYALPGFIPYALPGFTPYALPGFTPYAYAFRRNAKAAHTTLILITLLSC